MTRTLRLTADLVRRLPPRVDDGGPVLVTAPDPDYYETTAAQILAQRPDNGELSIFAVGSLNWNPRFEVAERRAAHVNGWRREFCLGPIRRMRGSPGAPGLLLSLDRGGAYPGVVRRIPSGRSGRSACRADADGTPGAAAVGNRLGHSARHSVHHGPHLSPLLPRTSRDRRCRHPRFGCWTNGNHGRISLERGDRTRKGWSPRSLSLAPSSHGCRPAGAVAGPH